MKVVPLRPQDRRTVLAAILPQYKKQYEGDGWDSTPRGDGYLVIRKRFRNNDEMQWVLDIFAKLGVNAWVVGD